jgi:hypothetical protein
MGAFGHATSSLTIFVSWKILKKNLRFWRFSIIESEKIKFKKLVRLNYTSFYSVAKLLKYDRQFVC